MVLGVSIFEHFRVFSLHPCVMVDIGFMLSCHSSHPIFFCQMIYHFLTGPAKLLDISCHIFCQITYLVFCQVIMSY